MNTDSPQSPREELEVRITALLLGELPAGEAAALRETISQDPDLQRLHDRLKLALELVREAGPTPALEQQPKPEPLTLATERRAQLLALFKQPAAGKIIRPVSFWRKQPSELVQLAAMVIGLLALAGMIMFTPKSARKSDEGADRWQVTGLFDNAPARVRAQRTKPVAAATPPPEAMSAPAASASPPLPAESPARNEEFAAYRDTTINGRATKEEARPLAEVQDAERAQAGARSYAAIILPPADEAGAVVQDNRRSVNDFLAFGRDTSGVQAGQAGGGGFGGGRFDVAKAAQSAGQPAGGPSAPQSDLGLTRGDVGGPHYLAFNSVEAAPGVANNPAPAPPAPNQAGLAAAESGTRAKTLAADDFGVAAAKEATPATISPGADRNVSLADQDGRQSGMFTINLKDDAPRPDSANKGETAYSVGGVGYVNLNEPAARGIQGTSGSQNAPVAGPAPAPATPADTTITVARAGGATANFSADGAALAGSTRGAAPASAPAPSGPVANNSLGYDVSAGEKLETFQDRLGKITSRAASGSGPAPDDAMKRKLARKPDTDGDALAPSVQFGISTLQSEAKPKSVPAQTVADPKSAQVADLDLYAKEPAKQLQDLKKEARELGEQAGKDAGVKLGARVDTELMRDGVERERLVRQSRIELPALAEADKEVATARGRLDDLQALPAARPVEELAKLKKEPAEAKGVKASDLSLYLRSTSGTRALVDESRKEQLAAEAAGKSVEDAKQKEPEPPAPPKVAPPNAPVPQPEVSATENAFSTFSLNVSDVSFKLAQASLEKGVLPDVTTVRSEEFINAFDYHDPEPTGHAPIAFAWERARYPFAHDRDLLRFSVKTAASGRQANRPLNLVLLLDNSGSMERADRVAIRQECLRVLAGQLQPQDRISVVAFARTARLWVDGLAGGQPEELLRRVGDLAPEGGTNLEDAMNVAYQTALKHFLPNGVNRVVLLTDGAANLGDVEPESLKKQVEAQRKQGVALDCFGIGWEGYNDDLLETLSRNGDGRYGFVNTPLAAATEFAGQLAGALKVAASDVKVQVEWNPRRVTVWRQIGYAKHQLKKEQFRDNTVDAAEIAAAEAGNALYTVQVNPRGEGPIGTVRVRFRVPGTSDYREHEWTVPYDGAAKPLEQAGATIRLAATASAFSEWLAASPFAGEVTPDRLLAYLAGVPEQYAADPRPKQLEWMIRQAKSVAGR